MREKYRGTGRKGMFTVSKRMMQIVREVKEKKRKKSNRNEREKSRNQTQRLPIQDTKPKTNRYSDSLLTYPTTHMIYPTSDTPTHSRALTLGSKLEKKKPHPPNATPTCTPHYLMINNNID